MIRRRPIWLIVLGLALTLVNSGCANRSSRAAGRLTVTTAKPGILLVGSSFDYKPFEYRQGKTLKGFDVEIMQEIGRRLGLKVEWVNSDFDTIFDSLAAGRFDAVAAAATIKPERGQLVDFSDPYFNSRQSLTVNASKAPAATSINQLTSDDIIGVQTGSIGNDWASANLRPRGIQIQTFAEITQAFNELEAGKITGIVNDEPSSEAEIRNRPGLRVIQLIDTGEHYGIAVGKNHGDILNAINASLKDMIHEGTYKKIFQKYFPGVPLPPEFGG